MRMLCLTIMAALSAGLAGCIDLAGWRTVSGSGNIVTENRVVAGFDRVSVSGAGELTLLQGEEEESLVIQADDNLLAEIRSEISGGRLIIGPRDVNLRPTQGIRYQLKLKNLRELHLSGSVRGQADRLKTDRLDLHISGSGKMGIARLEAGALATHISGSGSTSMGGKAETQELRISGSGNHHAQDLESIEAEVHISGSGQAALWVTEALTAHISGSGRVEYRGNPTVESHVSGSGRVYQGVGVKLPEVREQQF